MEELLMMPFLDQLRGVEPAPELSVVIAYEDLETGKHALNTYNYLAENLGKDSRLAQNMWKFGVLGIQKLREMAARDAAEADIIIISSQGGGGLPVPVRAWIDQWLASGARPLALVALFDCSSSHSRGVRTYLAEVASRAGIAFFSQPGHPETPLEKLTEIPIPERINGHRTLDTLAVTVQSEVRIPRWGINE
jgi:hypothetical protein